MIFSHFKRRRGIRFDDGFRHSARDREVDPLVATYDAILATDPTVPVLLQLTEYRGQQVLWQDPACTVPVEEIGDPIGGVRHPETGEILAVQETDSNRPVWGGREVGAVLDGGSYMTLSHEDFRTQHFQERMFLGESTAIMAVDIDQTDDFQSLFSWRYEGEGADQFYFSRIPADGSPSYRFWRRNADGSGSQPSDIPVENIPFGDPFAVGNFVSGDGTGYARITGSDTIDVTNPLEGPIEAIDIEAGIGARVTGDAESVSVEFTLTGDYRGMVIYQRELSESEWLKVSEALL